MTDTAQSTSPRGLNRIGRKAIGALPREARFALYRRMVECDAAPDSRLTLGIAATQSELEACFKLLHDAYVASGFMKPDPSGLRVTPYHALPTTTTLYARFDDRIVGTLSIIREGVFGFPLQSVFDLTSVRAQAGRIAEISALAVHPEFRNTGGRILFPLLKFMYEYCTKYFDTRHLVIAVNPKHIEMYESLLLFRRLQEQAVAEYDFVNGAPAIGATLDLAEAPNSYRQAYEGRRPGRNLHHYFTEVALPNIHFPKRPYYTTNDPVMSSSLLDYFFNRRTRVFEQLDERRRHLLHAIYPEDGFRAVLPALTTAGDSPAPLRRHSRYSLKCPAQLIAHEHGTDRVDLEVIDASWHGFLARASNPLPERWHGVVCVQLGEDRIARESAMAVRRIDSAGGQFYGFHIAAPGIEWQRCIAELELRDAPENMVRGPAPSPEELTARWSAENALFA
jgi:GNAT superfamily N-acetyltransferase